MMMKLHRQRSSSFSVAQSGDRETRDQSDEEDSDGHESSKKFGRRCSSAANVREWTLDDLEDLSVDSWHKYNLRCFNVSSKGLVIRKGDIVRYKRIRSMSIVPPISSSQETSTLWSNTLTIPSEPWEKLSEFPSSSRRASCNSDSDVDEFLVYLVGASNVGKTAIIEQFTTSEHILNSKSDTNQNPQVTVQLDSKETRLVFQEIQNIQGLLMADAPTPDRKPCAFVVVYSVIQEESFLKADCILYQLQQTKWSNMVTILVGNKSDLVRSRLINMEEGEMMACRYKVKFIETSVGINYNVDELLVGILRHLRCVECNHRIGGKSKYMERLSRARTSIQKMFSWTTSSKHKTQSHSCDIFKRS